VPKQRESSSKTTKIAECQQKPRPDLGDVLVWHFLRYD
jgi:hypothetical protein